MFKTIVIFFSIFAYSECGFISHNIKKCDIKDNDCQLDNFNNILKEAADKGIPEFKIPILDPYKIENVELDLGFLKATLRNGTAQGIKTCHFYNYRLEMKKKTIYVEVICEKYSIKSQYICKKTPLINILIGDIDIHGEGTVGIAFENKRKSLELVYDTKKFDDGEVHIVIIPDKIKFTFLGADKISVDMNNFYVGSQEISGVMVNIFNENWQLFSKYLYVNPIRDKINESLAVYLNNIFAAVPLKYLIKY